MAGRVQRERRKITVFAGAARCGKTARVVSGFVESARAGGSALVLVPDGRAAAAVRRRILEALPVLRSDVVLTFVALAEKVLASKGLPVREIPRHEREMLLRRIVAGLAREGRLAHFAPLVDCRGLYAELAAFIAELKSCQIEPANFRTAAFQKSQRDAEIAEIYTQYQEALEGANLYDGEGRFWKARVVLDEGCPFAPPQTLFIDGFTDFTANEMAILRSLARHVESLFVTLPHDPSRPELFAKTFETLARLKADFAVEAVEMPGPEGPSPAAHIASSFMLPDESKKKIDAAGAVRIISTAGVRMEMTEAAREAKRLIREGARASDIAVVVRAPSVYAPAALAAFRQMGVPLDADTALSPESSQFFGLLRTVVDLVEGDFEREAAVKLLSSSYVDLAGLTGAVLDGRDVRRLARAAGVVKGRGQWSKRLAALREGVKSQATADAFDAADSESDNDEQASLAVADLRRIEALAAAIERLAELVRPLAGTAATHETAARFGEIIEVLGVRGRILAADLPEDVLFSDLAAFASLKAGLDTFGERGEPSLLLSARSFVELLEAVVRGSGASSGALSNGGVALLDVTAARSLSFPTVFLCGVVADAFPAALPVGPFYSRAEREDLGKLGLARRTQDAHLAAERLLFYQAVTRAETRLYITYPATDEAGRPRVASFYLDELKSLFSSGTVEEKSFGPSRLVVPLGDAESPAEVSLAAGVEVGASDSRNGLAPASLGLDGDPAFALALRGAAIEARRESLESYDSFDGVLAGEAARSLARRFPSGTAWSGSLLNDYGACPFLFYLSRVLGVERPEEPDVVPTPLLRGSIAHDCLARFFSDVRNRKLTEGLYDENAWVKMKALFEAAFSEAAGLPERASGLAGDALWEIEKARLHAMLARFLEDELVRLAGEKAHGRHWEPTYFELRFGAKPRRRTDAVEDGRVSRVPVAVRVGGREENLCGKIDRVDLVTGPDGRGAVVIDYKLSVKPSAESVKSFEDMQLWVYLFALPDVICDPLAVPSGALYRVIKDGSGRQLAEEFENAAKYETRRAEFAAALFARVDSIRRGDFSPGGSRGCAPFCIGRGVCRLNEVRAEVAEEDDE